MLSLCVCLERFEFDANQSWAKAKARLHPNREYASGRFAKAKHRTKMSVPFAARITGSGPIYSIIWSYHLKTMAILAKWQALEWNPFCYEHNKLWRKFRKGGTNADLADSLRSNNCVKRKAHSHRWLWCQHDPLVTNYSPSNAIRRYCLWSQIQYYHCSAEWWRRLLRMNCVNMYSIRHSVCCDAGAFVGISYGVLLYVVLTHSYTWRMRMLWAMAQ